MDKLSQDFVQTIAFRSSIDREELFIRKCKEMSAATKDKELTDLVHELENISEEHIKMMKDKMIKLNIKIKI